MQTDRQRDMDTYEISRKSYSGGTYENITEYLSDIKLKQEASNCYAELTFTYPHDKKGETMPDIGFENADRVRVLNTKTGKTVFDGLVTKLDFSGKVTCKDDGFYTKNPIYLQAHKKRADQILKTICSKCGLSYGGPSYGAKITVNFANKKGTDCIQTVMNKLKKKNGKRYYAHMVNGALSVNAYQSSAHVIKVQRMEQEDEFDCTAVLSGISGSISMESLTNTVYAIKQKNSKTKAYAKATDTSGVKRYGKLTQYVTTDSKSEAASDARKKLLTSAQLSREFQVTVYASDDLTVGKRLSFDGSEYSDIEGDFWVTAVEHSLQRPHTAQLTLKRCTEDYVKASVKNLNSTIYVDKSSSSSGSYSYEYTGKLVDALYTAYYPANNKLEGGFYDCMGNKLDPSAQTCAAPKSVALKSQIQIKGTGTSKDGKIYTVNDRGGAINIVGGVYHFDLLMSTAAQCSAWGKRTGKALIITSQKKVYSSSGGSSSGSDVVSIALAELGKTAGSKYTAHTGAGASAPWCAAFVSWCARQAKVSTSVVTKTAAVSDLLSQAKSKGRFHYKGSYIPSRGDIFIEKSNGASHTGFVRSATSSGYTTIEGNSSGRVASHNRSYSYANLTGFYHPNY